jgi:TIR domain
VFQDKGIHVGDKWADILSNNLDSAKLLLILLSPTWLNSEWCRKEYTLFKSGSSQPLRPILPLIWDKILDHHVEKGSEADTIFSELKAYQIRDWTEFSEADWRSPDTNRAAGKLAEEIDRLLAP